MIKVVIGVFLMVLLVLAGCKDIAERRPPASASRDASVSLATVELLLVRGEDGSRFALAELSCLRLIAYARQLSGEAGVGYDVLYERELTARELAAGALHLEPGYYRFRHNSVSGRPPSGYYGDSAIVELRAGQVTAVRIELTAAI